MILHYRGQAINVEYFQVIGQCKKYIEHNGYFTELLIYPPHIRVYDDIDVYYIYANECNENILINKLETKLLEEKEVCLASEFYELRNKILYVTKEDKNEMG